MLWGKVNSTVVDASLRQARAAPERLGIPANAGSHGTPLLPPSTPKPRAALRLWLLGMHGPARVHHTGAWWRGSGTGWTACARLECRRETQPWAAHMSMRLSCSLSTITSTLPGRGNFIPLFKMACKTLAYYDANKISMYQGSFKVYTNLGWKILGKCYSWDAKKLLCKASE